MVKINLSQHLNQTDIQAENAIVKHYERLLESMIPSYRNPPPPPEKLTIGFIVKKGPVYPGSIKIRCGDLFAMDDCHGNIIGRGLCGTINYTTSEGRVKFDNRPIQTFMEVDYLPQNEFVDIETWRAKAPYSDMLFETEKFDLPWKPVEDLNLADIINLSSRIKVLPAYTGKQKNCAICAKPGNTRQYCRGNSPTYKICDNCMGDITETEAWKDGFKGYLGFADVVELMRQKYFENKVTGQSPQIIDLGMKPIGDSGKQGHVVIIDTRYFIRVDDSGEYVEMTKAPQENVTETKKVKALLSTPLIAKAKDYVQAVFNEPEETDKVYKWPPDPPPPPPVNKPEAPQPYIVREGHEDTDTKALQALRKLRSDLNESWGEIVIPQWIVQRDMSGFKPPLKVRLFFYWLKIKEAKNGNNNN